MIILTCNIRFAAANDGPNAWDRRKDFCTKLIRDQSPDIVCFQEMMAVQWRHMKNALPEFDDFGMVDEPDGDNPSNSIFYRRDRFERIAVGGYWLSQTPHVTGSKSWDSSCIRLANWVRLIDTNASTEFRVINTHLDHISQSARENQARLIAEDAAAFPDDYPQLLTGDMNCDTVNPAIDAFKAGGFFDTYGRIHGTEDPGYTYHHFLGKDFHESQFGKMDWVLARGNVSVQDAQVIDVTGDGLYASDHHFVSANVMLES